MTVSAQPMGTITAKVGDEVKLDVPDEYVIMTSWGWEWSTDETTGENYSMFNVQLLKVCLLAIRNNDVVPGWLSQPSPAYVKPSIGL